jgi:hypothetical protein
VVKPDPVIPLAIVSSTVGDRKGNVTLVTQEAEAPVPTPMNLNPEADVAGESELL